MLYNFTYTACPLIFKTYLEKSPLCHVIPIIINRIMMELMKAARLINPNPIPFHPSKNKLINTHIILIELTTIGGITRFSLTKRLIRSKMTLIPKINGKNSIIIFMFFPPLSVVFIYVFSLLCFSLINFRYFYTMFCYIR